MMSGYSLFGILLVVSLVLLPVAVKTQRRIANRKVRLCGADFIFVYNSIGRTLTTVLHIVNTLYFCMMHLRY